MSQFRNKCNLDVLNPLFIKLESFASNLMFYRHILRMDV